MKICYDALVSNQLKGTGLSSYNNEFISNLFEEYPQPNYDLLWDDATVVPSFKVNRKVSLKSLDINRKDMDFSEIENYLSKNNFDIYHSPNNGLSIPKNKVCTYVSTVYNLYPIVSRTDIDEKYLSKFNKVFPTTIENSDKIITLSNKLKDDLKYYFNVPDKKIKVIYPGCSSIFYKRNIDSSRNILTSKYSIKDEFLLCVGALHSRKNIDKLIYAFRVIQSVNRNIKLVIVGNISGKREEYYLKLKEIVHSLKLEDKVIFTGYVDYYDMPYFYSAAKALVNLSSYEGFPLSIIEAMACSTPVVCNDMLFFKEVASETGVFVDANDKESITESILYLLNSKTSTDNITQKQLQQCKKFSWEKAIKETIRIYEAEL